MGGDNGRKRGKGPQGTCIKDTWTKPMGVRVEGRRWGWWSRGEGGGKMETTVLEQQQKIF